MIALLLKETDDGGYYSREGEVFLFSAVRRPHQPPRTAPIARGVRISGF